MLWSNVLGKRLAMQGRDKGPVAGEPEELNYGNRPVATVLSHATPLRSSHGNSVDVPSGIYHKYAR